jgi:DNA-binding CsgD family transcriptional regulator
MNEADELYFKTVDQIQNQSREASLLDLSKDILSRYGLNTVAYFASNIPGVAEHEPYLAVTYAAEWVDHYKRSNYESIDPVLAQGFSSILPVDWSQLGIESRKHQKLFGEASEFGIGRQGLTIPVRGRFGERALFTVTSADTDAEWRAKMRWMMRDFQSIAHHFHQMVLRVEGVSPRDTVLAPRENDCLRWAACGKTSAEIGIILSISPRTVEYYLNQAKVKLDATNITQAVAKAMALSSFYRTHRTP